LSAAVSRLLAPCGASTARQGYKGIHSKRQHKPRHTPHGRTPEVQHCKHHPRCLGGAWWLGCGAREPSTARSGIQGVARFLWPGPERLRSSVRREARIAVSHTHPDTTARARRATDPRFRWRPPLKRGGGTAAVFSQRADDVEAGAVGESDRHGIGALWWWCGTRLRHHRQRPGDDGDHAEHERAEVACTADALAHVCRRPHRALLRALHHGGWRCTPHPPLMKETGETGGKQGRTRAVMRRRDADVAV
jgi:hypothetical protein